MSAAALRWCVRLGRCLPRVRRGAASVMTAGLTMALLALTGCTTLLVGQVDPALFPPAVAASAPPLPGRVALELPPAVRGQTHPGSDICAGGRVRIQLPLGAIVDAALQRQLGAAFSGGARPAALPLPAASDVEGAVTVVEVRLAFDHHLNWVVPLPVPWPVFVMPLAGSTDYSARMELDLRLTDGQGRLLSQTTVDSGRVVLERGVWRTESALDLCLKLTHLAAWQAGAQAAHVVRDLLQAERRRERAL